MCPLGHPNVIPCIISKESARGKKEIIVLNYYNTENELQLNDLVSLVEQKIK